MRSIIVILLMILLIACSSARTTYAPVTDVVNIESIPKKGTYRVASGDTLYSVAWRYGLDYRELAKRNNITPPFEIYRGQVLVLRGEIPKISKTKRAIWKKENAEEPVISVTAWRWPAKGPVVQHFSELNPGINIAGRLGDSVYATAAGKVVYSGNGLKRYGNLIIIKHNATYLTAYAYNRIVFVKEGEWVKAGQEIAEIGYTPSHRAMLHFEIRQGGKPVNPLSYLAGR